MNPESQDFGGTLLPFLDGAFVHSKSEEALDVFNPSNGKPCISIPAGCDADVDCAVASARRSFDDGRWSEAPSSFRKRTLHRWADLIAADAATLDALDAGEMGKPVSEARANASEAAGLTRFYAEAVDKVAGDVYGSDKLSFVTQRRIPRGVVGAVVPWNYPTFNAVLKLAPALAAGNSVILKPSELASRSALRIAQLALAAGFPPGVLNVVPGLGQTVGRALGLHSDVDMVTFTGSTDVGKRMLRYAGESNMKFVMTECGGKSPHIVFNDDVDLEGVSEAIAGMLLSNQGQLCSVGSRLLVHVSIEPEMVERLAARFERIVIGDALNPHTTFGPLVSAKQCARVMEYIESARSEGLQPVAGGRRTLIETGGYFVEPTLFRGVPADARIAQEEIFGPVLAIIPFHHEAEAVRIANNTMYGLMSYVWTADLSRGLRMAKAVRSSVIINAAVPAGEGPGHAFSHEPFRQSGLGVEGGLAGMESYMRRQLVWINHA